MRAKFQCPCKAPAVFEIHVVVNAFPLPGLEMVDKENWIAFQIYLNNFTLTGAGVFSWPKELLLGHKTLPPNIPIANLL